MIELLAVFVAVLALAVAWSAEQRAIRLDDELARHQVRSHTWRDPLSERDDRARDMGAPRGYASPIHTARPEPRE